MTAEGLMVVVGALAGASRLAAGLIVLVAAGPTGMKGPEFGRPLGASGAAGA